MKKNNRLQQALAFQAAGEFARAETLFLQHLKKNPSDVAALYSLGVLMLKRGDSAASLAYFDKALVWQPRYAPTWFNRGIVLQVLGRHDEAIASYTKTLELDPGHSQALTNRTALLRGKGEGVTDTDDATRLTTLHAVRMKALELQTAGNYEAAGRLFGKVIELAPHDLVSLYSMAVLSMTTGAAEEALRYADDLTGAHPGYAQGWYMRGTIRMSLRQSEAALADFDRALEADPRYIEGYVNRGAVLQELNRHSEAIDNFNRLLEFDPLNEKALANKGILLTQFKMFDAAIDVFETLRGINPESEYLLGQLCFAHLHTCRWDKLGELAGLITKGVREGRRVCNPLAFMAISGNPGDQLACARIFADHRFPIQSRALWQGEIYDHKRIRLAYISPDFREHPVGHLTAGVFEQHDRQRFELTAISLGMDDDSRIRRRMVAAFDHFIDARQMSSKDIAQLLRSMEIDIAVDLAGYTADSRTDVFSCRPAPVQVNYLGYSSTMGVKYFDYIIGDRHIIPEESKDCYSEKIVYLPDSYMPTDSMVGIDEASRYREEYGLPAGGLVFCSFNHDYKINPPVFDIWMRLLKKVPGSVLWLMKLNEAAERNLRNEALVRGISPERIIFATRVPRVEEHLARYRMADLFLDTTPYNAHTTTSDALRAGLPVVTCRSESFAGRVASGLLAAVGLPELITDGLEEYEALVLQLAQDSSLLQTVRRKLAHNLVTTPLYDTARYCRNLERAYSAMWHRYRQGQPPDCITVVAEEEGEGTAAQVSAMPGVAIVIPVYKDVLTEDEQFSVDCLIKTAPGRKKYFIAPESIKREYYCTRYNDIEFKFFEDRYFESIKGYNLLLLNPEFYQSFAGYDYILIHQTDALMFHDDLDYWMGRGFDYIGAPWPNGVEITMQLGRFSNGPGVNLKAYVGNGGFSLRSVKGAVSVLQEFADIADYWARGGSSEDLFFSFMGMISDAFSIPNQVVASRFSLEAEPEKYFTANGSRLPTGCHAGWRVFKDFWAPLIEGRKGIL